MTTTSRGITERDKARAELSRRDFEAYCRFVHGVELARHMKVWAGFLTSEADEDRKLAIAAPPEFWKSRLVRMHLEWSIGRHPERSTILAMNVHTQAEKQLKAIQATITENPRYRLTFPNVQPDVKRGWSGTSMYVKRPNVERPDPTLTGTGVNGPIQGQHVETIILDDPTDPQDVLSPSVLESQRQWIRGVLYDRLMKDVNEVPIGKFLAILTRWSNADMWPLLTNSPENEVEEGMGFRGIQMAAESRDEPYPWGPVLWPEQYPKSRLESIRITKGPKLYAMTFLCNPAAAGGNLFQREKFNHYEAAREDFTYRVHSWDTAGGQTDSAAFSVLCELSVNSRGYFVTFVWRARPEYPELREMILRLREDRKPNLVLIEDRSTGQSLIQEFQRDHLMPELRAIPRVGKPGDKYDRAVRHTGMVESGRVFVPRPRLEAWTEDFLAELAAFPNGRFDDQVDAFSQAMDYVRGHVSVQPVSGAVSWMAPNRRPAPERVYGAI